MSRVLTALVILPLALAGIFVLSGWPFLVFLTLIVELAVWEYVCLATRLTGGRVMHSLLAFVPIGVICLEIDLLLGDEAMAVGVVAFASLISLGCGMTALWSRRSLEQTTMALGLLAFGTAYFVLPIAALATLREIGPWFLLLAALVVWAGDTAAFYVGSRWGRHKLAPVVSPKKSWEGAIAGLAAAGAVGAGWSVWQLGAVSPGVLAGAIVVSAAGQLGDLVESSLKRRAGIKDSSGLLPGHGGMLDRLDSLLFAAPMLVLVLWALGWELP